MINCAHPTHVEPALAPGESWTGRIRGLRANSSSKSHAELDESTHLDEGNPAELGAILGSFAAPSPLPDRETVRQRPTKRGFRFSM